MLEGKRAEIVIIPPDQDWVSIHISMHHHYLFLGHMQMELKQLEPELVVATMMSQMHNLMRQVCLS